MGQKMINNVAIYLRKSRNDIEQEDVLSKHRDILLAKANQEKWNYQLYEEIFTGEELVKRFEMQKLLAEIKSDCYDAILVVDLDRLGRGEDMDWAIIKKTIIDSEILIVTPNRVYDLSDDADYKMFDLEAMFARWELKRIKKRFRRGKAAGAKQGKWVNGKPPFPYYYDDLTKTVCVDENKKYYYRMMVEQYLSGCNLTDICKWLSEHMPTPYGINPNNHWSYLTIERILISEVHLGYVVYGKSTAKSKNDREYLPCDEWKRYPGTHERLKTQEEHDAIMARLAKNKLKNPKARSGTLPLSGILYCKQCGRVMSILAYKENNMQKYRTRCENRYIRQHDKCCQRGSIMIDDFFNALYSEIICIDKNYLLKMEKENTAIIQYKEVLENKKREFKKQEQALNKVYTMYEQDEITKSMFIERRTCREKQISAIRYEIKELEVAILEKSHVDTPESIQGKIDDFKHKWNNTIDFSERNKYIRDLIEKIVYNKIGNTISLEICYK